LKDFVCSTVKPKQSMQEPNERPSKHEFECLVKRAEAMSQGYSISGLNLLSEESKDALKVLADFSKRYANEEPDVPLRDEDRLHAAQIRFRDMLDERDNVLLQQRHELRALHFPIANEAQAPIRAIRNRAGGGAAAPVRRPLRHPQYQSDSDDDFWRIIRRGS
jgi:hypothetical protein